MRNPFKASPFKLVPADTTNTNGTVEKSKPVTPGNVFSNAVDSGDLMNENQAAMVPDHDPVIPWPAEAPAPSPMKLK